MSGRSSRTKGAVAEREWATKLGEYGFNATRNRIGAKGDDIIHNIPGYSFEVKRQERLNIPAWIKQAVAQALVGNRIPVLAFRQSREPWRVVVDADHYLRLLQHSLRPT